MRELNSGLAGWKEIRLEEYYQELRQSLQA
jgi:hypothetical protein